MTVSCGQGAGISIVILADMNAILRPADRIVMSTPSASMRDAFVALPPWELRDNEAQDVCASGRGSPCCVRRGHSALEICWFVPTVGDEERDGWLQL